jgi:hypothetical protein
MVYWMLLLTVSTKALSRQAINVNFWTTNSKLNGSGKNRVVCGKALVVSHEEEKCKIQCMPNPTLNQWKVFWIILIRRCWCNGPIHSEWSWTRILQLRGEWEVVVTTGHLGQLWFLLPLEMHVFHSSTVQTIIIN